MKMSRSIPLVLTAAALGLACLAGCRGITPIKTLLDDPSRYNGKTVSIAGVVSGAAGILSYGTFNVDDGTGKLRVVTKEGGSPRDSARVGVEGEFREAYTLGTQTTAVLIEKRRFEAPAVVTK